ASLTLFPFQHHRHHRHPHSFPTRRSSDLNKPSPIPQGSPPSPTLCSLPEVAGPSGDDSRPVKLESQFLSREWCLGPAEGLPHYYRQLAAAASPPPSGKRG